MTKMDARLLLVLLTTFAAGCADDDSKSGGHAETLTATATLGDGDGDGDDATSKGDDGNSCEPGTIYCSCMSSGACGIGLVCYAPTDTCVPDQCPDGSPGCECLDGDQGCDAGLDCVNDRCTEPGAMCIQPNNPCWDFASDSQLEPCCEGTTCVRYEMDQTSLCAAPCGTHEECVTGCCATTNGGDNLCFTSMYCADNGKCIDTCQYANDGECDDGGPGSDFSLCALGTDCGDCGSR